MVRIVVLVLLLIFIAGMTGYAFRPTVTEKQRDLRWLDAQYRRTNVKAQKAHLKNRANAEQLMREADRYKELIDRLYPPKELGGSHGNSREIQSGHESSYSYECGRDTRYD